MAPGKATTTAQVVSLGEVWQIQTAALAARIMRQPKANELPQNSPLLSLDQVAPATAIPRAEISQALCRKGPGVCPTTGKRYLIEG